MARGSRDIADGQVIVHRADGALLKQGVRTAKDKIDVPCDLAVPVILGSRAAGRKAARAQKAVLLPLLLRQRGAEQGVLIAQQPHIRKKRAGAVHVSRHSLTHLGPGTGIILDGQVFHPQTFSAEKRRVAAEGMGGPAVRVRQPAAVAPHDAGLVHACTEQGNVLFFADQLFPVSARPDMDFCPAVIWHGQHCFGHRSKIAAAVLRHGNGKHLSVLPFCFYASIVYLLPCRKSTKFV